MKRVHLCSILLNFVLIVYGKDTNNSKCVPISTETAQVGNFSLTLTGTDIQFTLGSDETKLAGQLGLNLSSVLGQPSKCSEGDICWRWGTASDYVAELAVSQMGDSCYSIIWQTELLRGFKDCIEIGNAHWYVGPEEFYQHFPLDRSATRQSVAYLPGDMLQDKDKYFGGVTEPYWLTSKGAAVFVFEGTPLFYSWDGRNMCLEAKLEPPYQKPNTLNEGMVLMYMVCSKDDPKEMHMTMVDKYLGKPYSHPDEAMLVYPIWSTWAQYKADINESTVLSFASQIRQYNFSASQLEIDDNWETCYGQAEFDRSPDKFPNPEAMITRLKTEFGFRVTLWIHPFINVQCEDYLEAALPPKSYLVKDIKGREYDGTPQLFGHVPGLTYWWQGPLAGYLDFTNPEAVQWWTERLEQLRYKYGIESFKFDAGESNWMPSSFLLNETVGSSMSPVMQTFFYVATCSTFGNMVEVRVGRHTQPFPIFVRMLDKSSVWGYDNGLKTLVTTLLQISMSGYPFVLPDMVGGNGYVSSDDPLHEVNPPPMELFVRWLQATIFMPGLQFSFVPWIYDEHVVKYTQEMVTLREQYGQLIIDLAKNATKTGEPINRPIWWLDPKDEQALAIDSEFLLGNAVLIAPVLEENALQRDIYLPLGKWSDEVTKEVHQGPKWLRNYSADLFTLPYFVRQE